MEIEVVKSLKKNANTKPIKISTYRMKLLLMSAARQPVFAAFFSGL